jgi:uncharacterized protein
VGIVGGNLGEQHRAVNRAPSAPKAFPRTLDMENAMREAFGSSLKDAMKSGDKRRVATLRMVQATLKDKDIEARGLGKTFGDEEVPSVLQKMIKSRQESLAIYEKAGRADLAAQEREEIAIIEEFLPPAVSEDETIAAVDATIAETGAVSMKDMGKVVASLKSRYAGRMDFAKVSALVKARLSA